MRFFLEKEQNERCATPFELASKRKAKVTSATEVKMELFIPCRFGTKCFKMLQKSYPHIETDSQHIDALAAFFVTNPSRFDVIVASNLFGDILTDIGAAIMGSIGVAPAANINVNGKCPSDV